MTKTELLPTVTAVRMVWAMTGKFSNDDPSKELAINVEIALKDIEDQAQDKNTSPEEKGYVTSATATMKASLRNLDVAYKGRTLNFEENEKLREAYLESVKESLNFGERTKDLLKSLPTMTIGAAGGVTVAQLLGIPETFLWGIGLILAAMGYLVNLWFVRLARRKTKMLYVTQDYERTLYYDHYISRATYILIGLFLDLERIHKRVFHENYESDTNPGNVKKIIDDILAGVSSTFCPYTHKHMREGKITPELWPVCESGHDEAVHICPLWEGQRKIASIPGKEK